MIAVAEPGSFRVFGNAMKFLLFMVMGLSTIITNAQEHCPPDLPCGGIRRFMEYGDVRWRDERRVLDHLADSFRRSNDQVIYFVIYARQNSCKDEAKLRAMRARKYLVQRHKIPPAGIVWKNGGFRVDLSVEIWLLPKDQPLPEPSTSVTLDPSQIHITGKCKATR